jgi:hypothetical protein
VQGPAQQAAGNGAAGALLAAQARQEASPLPWLAVCSGAGRCAPRTCRTTWTTGRPRGPRGRPRSRRAGPWVSPSDIRRARGAGASSRPGVRLRLTQTQKKRPILVSAWPPAGPREARVLVKPFRTVLYYYRPAGSDLYASDYGCRDPKTPHRRRFQSKMTRDPPLHTRSATRAAHAPPAARTRHISRGDTRWTILQLLGRLPGHLGRPVARAVQRAARAADARRPRMAGRRVRKRSHAACRGSSTPGGVVGDSLQQ